MQGAKNLTEGAIGKQLFKLAVPIMGTSFIQMAYSITDMAWVGRLGSESVAAIGAVGILTWLMASLSLLCKIGAEVGVGQSIGSKNITDARNYASHNITIALIISVCLGVILFILANPILRLYNLNEVITKQASEYLRIVSTAFPFIFLTSAFTGIYNAAGRSHIPFFTSGIGLVLNMVLDPLFILCFKWGTNGAALATWISQCAVVVLFFILQRKKKDRVLGGFPLLCNIQKKYATRILKLGLPVAMLNAFFAIINSFMARTASTFGGHIGLMTLTAGGQVEAIAWNTSQGFSTALGTFVSQNFAARKKSRIKKAYHITLSMTATFGLLCTLLFIFFGSEIFSLIVPEQAAYTSGGDFLRIDGYSMILMMVEITMQGLFYGTGRTVPPAIISITANILRIPLAILFTSLGFGVNGVWWAISISSMLKGITAFIWYHLLQKKIFSLQGFS